MISSGRVAIIELIANCWDAGATEVHIQWPTVAADNVFSIRDNGIGMTTESFTRRFMKISYNRIEEQGRDVEFPPGVDAGKRKAFGKNGIGRLSAFCFADRYYVSSTQDGINRFTYEITQDTSQNPVKADPVENSQYSAVTRGTVIFTKEFNGRSLDIQDLRKEIGMRFISDPNFLIFVNGEKINLLDIPSINVHNFTANVEGIDPIAITAIDTARPDGNTNQHGVAWHVNGRLVGECSWKGPNGEKFLDGRKSIAKRFTFLVRADALSDLLKADWTGFDAKNELYGRVLEAVNLAILQFISEFFKEARAETFNEIKDNVQPVLRKLSPIEIENWEGFVKKTQEECFNISDELLEQLAMILANLLQAKSRFALLHKLSTYDPNQMDDLNDILSKWTLDMAKIVLDELEIRMLLVKDLKAKVNDTTTDELKDLQPLFERGLWIFGPEFESIHYTSNVGMTRVLKTLFNIDDTGSRNRPDFVVLPDSTVGIYSVPAFDDEGGGEIGIDRVVIVELKKPGITLGSDQREQAMKYVRELKSKSAIQNNTKVVCYVLGSTIDPLDAEPSTQGNTRVIPMTYNTVVARSESRLLNLKKKVEDAPFLQEQGLKEFIETNKSVKAQGELEGV